MLFLAMTSISSYYSDDRHSGSDIRPQKDVYLNKNLNRDYSVHFKNEFVNKRVCVVF